MSLKRIQINNFDNKNIYSHIKTVNNNYLMSKKIENYQKNEVINENEKVKFFFERICKRNIKKNIKNNLRNITHNDFSNMFKIIDNSHQEKPFNNKTRKNSNLSLSQKNIPKNLLKEESIEKKRLKNLKNKKHIFWVNPFLIKLNQEIYKSKNFLNQFKRIKNQKSEMSLENYHNNLIKISSLNFSKESIEKLNFDFKCLRRNYSVKILPSKKFIEKIEEEENKIYKKISENQNNFIKLLGKFKLKILKNDFPKIEMKTILKS